MLIDSNLSRNLNNSLSCLVTLYMSIFENSVSELFFLKSCKTILGISLIQLIRLKDN